MMKNKQQLPHHTHFVGFRVPTELEGVVFDCREYMRSVYGCRSGYGTPPHITLIAPFSLPEDRTERDVFETAEAALAECREKAIIPFEVRVRGFGCFSERTLFAHVEDSERWQEVHAVFAAAFSRRIPGSIKKPLRRFYPHLSVANRDIPAGVMDEALRHFAELNLDETFTADDICVYTRTPTGGWEDSGQDFRLP